MLGLRTRRSADPEDAMKHLDFFRRHPVFTGNDLAAHLADYGEVGPRGQEALLAYHQRRGRIVRVRRGLYAVVPPGSDAESFPIDPYLVAAKLTPDAVLSHHTALEFHGRASAVWGHRVYSTTRPPSPVTFRSDVFRGVGFPAALRRVGAELMDVQEAERAGLPVRVTGLERTLVDVVDRPDLAGGWEEIWRTVGAIEFVDLDRIVAYALKLDNATTIAKVGLVVSQHQDTWMITDRQLRPLRDRRPRRPHYLDRSRRVSGHLVKDWNLVVPSEVLDGVWDEVL